jgi:DNA-directed RNA polymerase specialized sigma24 family protein
VVPDRPAARAGKRLKAAADGSGTLDSGLPYYSPNSGALGNTGDAEDVAQEALVLAYRRLRQFRGDARARLRQKLNQK